MTTVCPGCSGPKSKRAELCATCRRQANAVGASVLTHVHEAATPVPSRPRTPQQNTVYHGRCSDLAKLLRLSLLEVKKRTLTQAGKMFDRVFTSSTQLAEIEMEQLLEWLLEELETAKANAPAAV